MIGYAIQFIADTFRESQAEQRRWQAELAGAPDWEPITVMIATALALTLRHYFLVEVDLWGLMENVFPAATREQLNTWRTAAANREFVRLFSWTAAQTVGFLIAPFLCCLILRKRPAEYGWKLDREPGETSGEFHFAIGTVY